MEQRRRTALLRRRRLEDLLEGALDRRLILVTANAGFGKSTLLAQWAQTRRVGWLAVTREDRHMSRFLARIVNVIGEVRDSSVQASTDPQVGETSPHAVASWLAQEIAARLEADLVLVLDDMHELGSRGAAVRFVEALLLQAPMRLHFVLASRSEPPFPTQRLRGQGQVFELSAADLAFRRDEIAALVADAFGAAAVNLTDALEAATRGWPAAVRLAIESLRPLLPADRPAAIDRLRRPDGPLLDYLAEEVIGRQPEATREFIQVIAVLDDFNAESCEALGLKRARETIEQLERGGLAVRHDPNGFALHELLRDFALARMPLTTTEQRDVLRRAAAWSEANGEVTTALRYATEANDSQYVRQLLAAHGHGMLLAGQAASIAEAARIVEPLDRGREVDEVIGEAHAIRGEWDNALACYLRAAAGAAVLPARLAWLIGRLEWDRGRFSEALDAFSRGLIDGSSPRDEALLLAAIALAHWNRGEAELARSAAERAVQLAITSSDQRALAAAHMAVAMASPGWDARRRREHFRLALQAAEEAGDVLQTIRLRVNLSAISTPGDGLREIEPAIRLAEVAGSDISLAVALNNRGEHLLALGRYEDAAVDLHHASKLFEGLGSGRVSWALMNLGDIARERGDLALARSFYEDAGRMALESDDAQGLIGSKAGLARLVAQVEPQRARELAADAVARARPLQLHVVRALLASGWVALVQGRLDDAESLGAEAETAARAQGRPPDIAETFELQAMSCRAPDRSRVLLEDAQSVWRDIGNEAGVARADLAIARLRGDRVAARLALHRLRTAGVSQRAADAACLLASLPPAAPSPVEVRTLGGFAVAREGRAVPIGQWRSRKARDLVKILVSRRGRPVPREELIDILWRDAEPAEAANRLSVATSLARSVLDRNKQYPPNHFIAADRETLALVRDNLVIDVEDFLAQADAGLMRTGDPAAIARLEDAEALYAGDFLEEDVYDDWAVALREEARATYIAVARRLAESATGRGDHDMASRHLRRVLERDQFDEGAHLDLVGALARASRHGEARRAYRAYLGRMEELGVEAAPYPS